VHFAGAFPALTWQPSDLEPENLASIQAWRDHALLDNLKGPMRLDVRHLPWPRIAAGSLDAVVAINLIHISPWECTGTLMRGAAAALKPGGVLYLYGPYRIDGAQTAPSNEAFEGWLKGLDQRFGVRDLGEVHAEAEAAGLEFAEKIAMPANNFSVVFRKA
jgi:SAM-dependent methyltransferase